MLVTCSRDKKIAVWGLDQQGACLNLISTLKRSSPLTCVAFHPTAKYIVAVGNEVGFVSFWNIDPVSQKWSLLKESRIHGNSPVNRMQFKKVPLSQSVMLLTCSDDHTLRLTRVCATDAFSQLCALILSAEKALNVSIPQIVSKNIIKFM